VTTEAPKKASTRTRKAAAKKTVDDEGGRWLTGLELKLMRFHQQANARRGWLRTAHRMPFVQCRQCDELRRAAMAAKREEQQAKATSS